MSRLPLAPKVITRTASSLSTSSQWRPAHFPSHPSSANSSSSSSSPRPSSPSCPTDYRPTADLTASKSFHLNINHITYSPPPPQKNKIAPRCCRQAAPCSSCSSLHLTSALHDISTNSRLSQHYPSFTLLALALRRSNPPQRSPIARPDRPSLITSSVTTSPSTLHRHSLLTPYRILALVYRLRPTDVLLASRAEFQARPTAGKVALTILSQTDAELSLQQHLDLAPDILSYPRLTTEGGTEPLMMAQPVPHQANQATDKKRVKVYELRNNDWFDRGTGFCTAAFMQTEDGQPRDPRVIVESEEHPDRLLLETKICKEDGFQKQQETLIVWTEPSNGIDMALSFQESEGCTSIWNFVHSVQQTFQQNGVAGADDSLSDDLAMELPSTISLPPAEIGNLPEIEASMRIMSQTTNGRDALAKCIMGETYIDKLIPLVEMAEDLESLPDLHRLCNIMKTIILLNDTAIIEHAVSDECVIGVVGALEYDPDFPSHKANHRHWLGNQGRYKEVVPIEEEQIQRKIHQTYRLQYLKDVVLARILDDPTFSVLNSLIFFNQVDIVQHLQGNGEFLNELFSIFKVTQPDQRRKKEAVLFIQQCCAIAKNLQPPARQSLYANFIAHGLFQVINFGLRHGDVGVRVGATDVLVSLIDHDPQMIRSTIYRQMNERASPLTDSLIDLLLVEVDLGVKSQISDALKVLFDYVPPQIQHPEAFMKGNGEFPVRPQHESTPLDSFIQNFYSTAAPRLFRPLLDLDGRTDMNFSVQQASMFTYLVEILCFFIRQHGAYARTFVVAHDVLRRISQLFACPEKYLQLVAIRFFRHLVNMQDGEINKEIRERGVLEPLLGLVFKSMPRDNLLSSACVEFFQFITQQEGGKIWNKFLVENYRDRVVELSYMDTFRSIIVGFDQTQGYTLNLYTESEEDHERRVANPHARLSEHLAIEQEQEEYFNTSDDEDGPESKAFDKVQPTNGSTSLTQASKPLVDYSSDEEADENADPEVLPTSGENQDGTDGASDTSSESSPIAPPERLSEKRRREEDDDDELGKLMHHKRRNSSSTGSNASMISGMVRRKKGFSDRSTTTAPKKIAISISPSVKTGGTARSDDGS